MTSIFISYSKRDQEWEACLRRYLQAFGADRDVSVWDDTMVGEPSAEARFSVDEAIAKATFAVCLLSGHYLASRSAPTEEMPTLLQRAERREIVLIPVLLADAQDVKETRWLQGKHLLTANEGRSISESFNEVGDRVFEEVAHAILNLVAKTETTPDGRLASPVWRPSVLEDAAVARRRAATLLGEAAAKPYSGAPMPDINYEAYLRDRDRLADQHGACVVAYADGSLIAVAKDAKTLLAELPDCYRGKSLLITDVPDLRVKFRRPYRLH